MEELMIAFEILTDIAPRTNRMNMTAFGSFYCMLLEEWCKEHNENIVEFINNVHITVIEVNADMGRY